MSDDVLIEKIYERLKEMIKAARRNDPKNIRLGWNYGYEKNWLWEIARQMEAEGMGLKESTYLKDPTNEETGKATEWTNRDGEKFLLWGLEEPFEFSYQGNDETFKYPKRYVEFDTGGTEG